MLVKVEKINWCAYSLVVKCVLPTSWPCGDECEYSVQYSPPDYLESDVWPAFWKLN